MSFVLSLREWSWGWVDRRRLCAARADYYAYVAALMLAQGGRRSLRDVFENDAHRYGMTTSRGRLSAVWCHTFESSGGNLAHTWRSVFPAADLALLAVAQRDGVHALPTALADLAHTTRLVTDVRRVLSGTTLTGLIAGVVVVLMLAAIPLFTVPRLQHIFHAVSINDAGPVTRALYASADLIAVGLPWLLVSGCAAVIGFNVARSRWTGRLRARLDRWPLFRLYRDFQAIRFLLALTLVVRQDGAVDTRLRPALHALGEHASPWLAAHLHAMVLQLDAGAFGADIFDTGLFDSDTYWFMADVMGARGLPQGLAHARARMESLVCRRIAIQAQALRWGLLLCAVGLALSVVFWHFAALDELRRALVFSMTAT